MGEFIDISVGESLSERWQSVGWAGMTPAEQELLALDWVVARVSNSGLDAAYADLQAKWPKAIDGLKRIGAWRLSELLQEASASPCGLDDAQQRALEDRFWKLYELEQPDDLVAKYAATNVDAFPGPRSLNQVWQQMQSRGISQKPKCLAEMERHAEADAQVTDQRCRTCGQPVPMHKSKCRRCGRPYATERPVA